ncbi:MAG: hypothetical protein VW683_00095 [Betaproteobacteria bacterium]
MKIGIVGHGFVGGAVEFGFTNERSDITIVDPKYENGNTIADLQDVPFIFVCVPTPPNEDGTVNTTIMDSVFSELNELTHNPIVILKSTITPDFFDNLDINFRLVYNPEFLTERNANQDFIRPSMQLLSGETEDCHKVRELYANSKVSNDTPTIYTDWKTASLVKYAINSFLASKVIWFNQFKNIFDKTSGSEWKSFVNIITTDPRIGMSHMDIPGPDGKVGFGGHCFPKDTMALLSYSENIGEFMSVLEEIIDVNNKIRNPWEELKYWGS